MNRVVILGAGASGKSTLAVRLSDDAVDVRLRAADTIIFLDFSLVRCAWRAVRQSRERSDFWLWLLRYRRQSRPFLMDAIANHAANATLHILRNPEALKRFVADVAHQKNREPG